MFQTITLGDEDGEPRFSLCRGHVDVKTFNKAFMAEGWNGDEIPESEIEHEYWRRKEDVWSQCEKGDDGAEPVTVVVW